MSDQLREDRDARLLKAAQAFRYPPMPDIANNIRLVRGAKPAGRNRLVLRYVLAVAILACVLLVGMMGVPSVRAAVLEFLQVGVVRIFLVAPTPTTSLESAQASPMAVTPTPEWFDLVSISDLGGETTLEEARAQAGFTILLPAYPSNLGAPDHVFLQEMGGPMVVLVWSDPLHTERARLSLFAVGKDNLSFEKIAPENIEYTTVNGEEAIWAQGPYLLKLRSGEVEVRRLIQGSVLIWKEGEITYRLETDLLLDEARKIAESLE